VVHALDGARLLRTLSALPPPEAVFARLRRLFTPQVVVLVRDAGCGGPEFCTRVGRELGYATLDVPALLAAEAARGTPDGRAIGAALGARRTPPLGPTLGVLERAMAACASATPRFILDGFPRVISAGFPGVHDQVMAAEERLGAFKGAVVLSAALDTRIARAGAKAPGEVAVVRAAGDTYRRERLPVAHFFEKLGKVCAIDTTTPLAINPDDLLEAARPYLE
jgi:adenylate kinase family enzyme